MSLKRPTTHAPSTLACAVLVPVFAVTHWLGCWLRRSEAMACKTTAISRHEIWNLPKSWCVFPYAELRSALNVFRNLGWVGGKNKKFFFFFIVFFIFIVACYLLGFFCDFYLEVEIGGWRCWYLFWCLVCLDFFLFLVGFSLFLIWPTSPHPGRPRWPPPANACAPRIIQHPPSPQAPAPWAKRSFLLFSSMLGQC